MCGAVNANRARSPTALSICCGSHNRARKSWSTCGSSLRSSDSLPGAPNAKSPLKICTFKRYSARLMRKSELV
jgi:hypothetical protein